MIQALPISQLNETERPQERLERLGANALSDIELLAMLLRSGCQGMDVMTLATNIIQEAGSLSGLLSWSTTDFCNRKGIGKVKALQLITVIEIAKRILVQQSEQSPHINSAEKAYAHILPHTAGLTVEKFWVFCLNSKNRLIRQIEISSGIANASIAHPREIYREAIKLNATAIIAIHNHPSGDPAPSAIDIKTTRQIRESGKTLGIELLDHIIAGSPEQDPTGLGFYSFKNQGLL